MPVQNTRSSSSKPTVTNTGSATPTPQTPPADDADAEALPSEATNNASAAPARRSLPHEVKSAETALRHAMIPTVMTPSNADAALGELLKLKDADLAEVATSSAEAQPQKFRELLASASPEMRQGLLDRLSRAGAIPQEPGIRLTAPPRAPQPPPGPALYKDNPSLPAPLRELSLQRNLELAHEYQGEYAAYRERYGKAVDGAATVGALRELGPLAAPALPDNLPRTVGAIEATPYEKAYSKARGPNVKDTEMETRVADRARTITGRPVAGLSLTLKGSVMVTFSNVSSFGAAVGVTRNADGSVSGGGSVTAGAGGSSVTMDHTGKLSAKLKAGENTVGTDGETVEVGTTSSGPPTYGSHDPDKGANKGRSPADDAVGANVRVGKSHVGATVSVGDASLAVDVDNASGASITTGVGPLSATTSFNGDSIGQSISGELGFGDPNDVGAKVSVEAGYSAQGVTAVDRAGFVSARDVGFYDTPPELAAGKKWSALPKETRMLYEAQGWTEKEWQSKASLATALVGRR